jgi:transposase
MTGRTPRHSTPRHSTPRHSTPRHSTPRHSTPGHSTPDTERSATIIGGVDTHGRTHHAAALDHVGGLLADRQFPATTAGYTALAAWLHSFGRVATVGVEGTGSYGAGLARALTAAGISVVEVNRPDRRTRRTTGKSDPIDAVAAARAVLAGQATATPKTRTGPVEAIRVMRLARAGAVKARTAALNQLKDLITTAPEPLRTQLRAVKPAQRPAACAALDIDEDHLHDPAEATKAALQSIATRVLTLTTEIKHADARLTPLVAATAPTLLALPGVGPEVAGQLLCTAGDNPHRLHNEAALARLCGTAPIPASSGTTHRHRLHRGGDRHANAALYTITLCRLHYDQRTRDYMHRRTQQGLTTKEIIRCLKRYITRDIFKALTKDLATLNNPTSNNTP